MAKESYEIYQRRKPLKIILKILLSIILAAFLLAVIIFFWFQTYIVYTADGIRLDIPFLDRGEMVDTALPGQHAVDG